MIYGSLFAFSLVPIRWISMSLFNWKFNGIQLFLFWHFIEFPTHFPCRKLQTIANINLWQFHYRFSIDIRGVRWHANSSAFHRYFGINLLKQKKSTWHIFDVKYFDTVHGSVANVVLTKIHEMRFLFVGWFWLIESRDSVYAISTWNLPNSDGNMCSGCPLCWQNHCESLWITRWIFKRLWVTSTFIWVTVLGSLTCFRISFARTHNTKPICHLLIQENNNNNGSIESSHRTVIALTVAPSMLDGIQSHLILKSIHLAPINRLTIYIGQTAQSCVYIKHPKVI